MPTTRRETISLVDAAALEVSVREPAGAVRGGIVVLPAGAVTARIDEILAVLADDGWLALAPHHRAAGTGGPTDPGSRVEAAMAAVLADSDACFGWLADRGVDSDRMGVLGFDRGATAALVVASQRSLGAAVSVAAAAPGSPAAEGLPALRDVVGELTCPWLGLYGEIDIAVDPAAVDALREAAHARDRIVDVVVYPAQEHRFDAGTASARDAASTVAASAEPGGAGGDPVTGSMVEARSRVLNWYDAHLR